MDNENTEIIDGTWGGSGYGSAASAAVACLIDTLTAGGTWSAEYALDIMRENKKDDIIRDLADQRGLCAEQVHEVSYAGGEAHIKLVEMA